MKKMHARGDQKFRQTKNPFIQQKKNEDQGRIKSLIINRIDLFTQIYFSLNFGSTTFDLI